MFMIIIKILPMQYLATTHNRDENLNATSSSELNNFLNLLYYKGSPLFPCGTN